MSSSAADRLTQQLLQTTQKIASLQANRLARERRVVLRSKQKERRARLRRRIELGIAVERAGMADWKLTEIVGALVQVNERIGASKTMRMAAQKRGEQSLRNDAPGSADQPLEADGAGSVGQPMIDHSDSSLREARTTPSIQALSAPV